MSIPYNIIELFTKYFIDKNKGQFELNEILQNLKRGNSFRIMWELFQKLKDNLHESDICKLYEIIGPEIELKYGINNSCCAVIWELDEDKEMCYPSRCKKDIFTNYNFCKNHYPPISEDNTSTIINYKWKQNGCIFDSNIQPSYLKFKKSLYDKNNISSDTVLVSHNYFQFNIIEYLNLYKIEKSIENNKLPIVQVHDNQSNNLTTQKLVELKPKKIINETEVIKVIPIKKIKALPTKMKQLYYTNLLISAMISKEIKIDKNHVENVKIYDDLTIYQKDKQFIFKGLRPVGIILDCDTVYMIKDIIQELSNHSIDSSLKDAFIESLS